MLLAFSRDLRVVMLRLASRLQTLRYYERVGLIEPFRSRGNFRLYSEQDIERLREVKRLMEDLGVNLAGVEVVLNMREKMERMHLQMREFVERVQRELGHQPTVSPEMKNALVRLVPASTRPVPVKKRS